MFLGTLESPQNNPLIMFAAILSLTENGKLEQTKADSCELIFYVYNTLPTCSVAAETRENNISKYFFTKQSEGNSIG